MSANRKLLTEIQQVLKKVEEGVELFDDIWEKVYSAAQQSLKEKYEADLKKEIKKLQRLRDQIKTWIGSNEIKDKSQLTEARKIIESKMEQFKICEKDTKTKAYSKEGLAREARLDPKEAIKEEKRNWLNDCLERLNDLINCIEADKEKLLNSKGNKAKNKEQMEKFDKKILKHKWHIARLEQILKLIENDDLEPNSLDNIKDSLEYYLESAADDDGGLGVEDEFDIYEDLQLDTLVPSVVVAPNSSSSSQNEVVIAKNPDGTSESVIQSEPIVVDGVDGESDNGTRRPGSVHEIVGIIPKTKTATSTVPPAVSTTTKVVPVAKVPSKVTTSPLVGSTTPIANTAPLPATRSATAPAAVSNTSTTAKTEKKQTTPVTTPMTPLNLPAVTELPKVVEAETLNVNSQTVVSAPKYSAVVESTSNEPKAPEVAPNAWANVVASTPPLVLPTITSSSAINQPLTNNSSQLNSSAQANFASNNSNVPPLQQNAQVTRQANNPSTTQIQPPPPLQQQQKPIIQSPELAVRFVDICL
eukprot:gene4631-6510_t